MNKKFTDSSPKKNLNRYPIYLLIIKLIKKTKWLIQFQHWMRVENQ